MIAPPRLELRLLGRFAVLRDDVEIPPAAFGGRKVRALLRILATRRGEFVSNDVLTEMLWPDRPPADPAANLQVLVTRARKALGAGVVETGPGGYALAGGPTCTVDTEQLLSLARPDAPAPTLESLAEALAGSGEPLAEDAYADWATEYRARVLRVRQEALEQAADLALDAGRPATAVEYASAAAQAEPLRETAVLALVRALVAVGDPAAALVRYDAYRRALADELGVDPSADAAALHQQLLRGSAGAPRTPRRRPASVFAELPFVGRDDELRRISAALDAGGATGGPGARVLVAGESGSGKSRLVASLALDTPVVVARAVAPERAEPWSLVRTLLRELLAEDVAQRDALPPPLASALGSLLPEYDDGVSVTADPASLRALVQEATIRVLAAADRVVAVDDLQWADPTSLAALETAAARVDDLRLLLAYRPEEVADDSDVAELLRQMRADVDVRLGVLTPDSIGELVGDEDLAAALVTHTDRSPMSISEVVRALATEGLVVVGADHRWRVADADAVARAVELGRQGKQQAIRARAARQSPEARQVLELLCVAAREVSAATLAAALDASEAETLRRLGELFRAGLVRLGESGWAASHDMVTETLVDALGAAARATLHARLAEALDADGGDSAELARHRLAAGDAARAAEAFARAAQEALAAYADQEAVRLADAGLAGSTGPRLVGTLREVRAEALARLGDIPGARRDLRAALAGLDPGPDRSRVLGRLAMLASGSEDLVRAGELAELALVEAGGDQASRARALEVASVIDMNLDRTERAAERAEAALDLYRRLGDANGTARVLDARAMGTFLGGDVERGGVALRQAADLFEDSGDLVRVVTPRSTSGHALVFAGRAAEGLTVTTAALDLARTLGHPEGMAYALWHRTEALAALARPDEASQDAREALALAERLGHRGWTATSWRAVGIASESGGDLDEALAAHLRSLDLSENLGLFASWAAARAALVLVALGDHDRARPLVARALAEGPPLGHYEARLARAELAAATADPRAADLARDALVLADAGGVRQGRERLVRLAAAVAPGAG